MGALGVGRSRLRVEAFAALCLAVAVFWGTPVATSVSASRQKKPLPAPVGFTVKASNGYSLFAFGARAYRGRPASVGVYVSKGNDGVFYSTPGTVTETSFEADLGALGRIAVSFHPSGKARTVRSECGGKPVSFDSGSYVGAIDFHGEEDYTQVEASSGRGSIGFLLDVLCPGSGGGSGPMLPGAQLIAGAET